MHSFSKKVRTYWNRSIETDLCNDSRDKGSFIHTFPYSRHTNRFRAAFFRLYALPRTMWK